VAIAKETAAYASRRNVVRAPAARLAHDHLRLDPRVVQQRQRAVDRLRRGGVPEAMGDQQAPVPVVPRVGACVARRQVQRRFDVARLVGQAHVQLQVRPVVGKRIDDLPEAVREAHCEQA
jgi:hypothetical protein